MTATPDFFKMAYKALPADGVMLLHTIVGFNPAERQGTGHSDDASSWPDS